MSAILCGKISFFEDNIAAMSPPVTKRIHCSSSSPVRFSPSRSNRSLLLDRLAAVFSDMDNQDCFLGSLLIDICQMISFCAFTYTILSVVTTNGEVPSTEDPSAAKVFRLNCPEWVELFVREMISANIDDARAHASRALEIFEKSICARASAQAAQSFYQENKMLEEQIEALIQENMIPKRVVGIQHERQKEYEDWSRELHHLKQLVSQYQEQMRTPEARSMKHTHSYLLLVNYISRVSLSK